MVIFQGDPLKDVLETNLHGLPSWAVPAAPELGT